MHFLQLQQEWLRVLWLLLRLLNQPNRWTLQEPGVSSTASKDVEPMDVEEDSEDRAAKFRKIEIAESHLKEEDPVEDFVAALCQLTCWKGFL